MGGQAAKGEGNDDRQKQEEQEQVSPELKQIGGLLHDYATLMAAGGQCAQTAVQIDQRLRHELLFRHVHSKVSSPLVSAIFGLLDFASWRVLGLPVAAEPRIGLRCSVF